VVGLRVFLLGALAMKHARLAYAEHRQIPTARLSRKVYLLVLTLVGDRCNQVQLGGDVCDSR